MKTESSFPLLCTRFSYFVVVKNPIMVIRGGHVEGRKKPKSHVCADCKRKNKKCSVEFITQKSCRRGFLCRDCGAEHSRFYGIISTRVGSNEIFNVIFPGQPLHARMMKRRKILKTSPRAKAEFERQREKCTYSILSRP
jgi:hypothetical protein